jgi:hypothetical protein
VVGFCEHENEHSVSMKGDECLDWLSDYKLLKESLLWNELISSQLKA